MTIVLTGNLRAYDDFWHTRLIATRNVIQDIRPISMAISKLSAPDEQEVRPRCYVRNDLRVTKK